VGNRTVQLLCMCCGNRLSKTFRGNEDSVEIGAAMRALAEEKGWHELPAVPGRRRDSTDICDFCWAEIRGGESPEGSRAPSVYVQGMEDGEDHCTVCSAALEGDDGHTHQQCFEEGKNLGALDENLDCASKLAERIGCSVDYFHDVLERVPPARRLPGELRQATLASCHLVFANPEVQKLDTVTGLLATVFIPMPAETARFTYEHIGRVGRLCTTVQVSIDDNGHTCWSDDGVTCVRCQRDMHEATEVANG
jgi:hypothetical protein